MKVFVWGIRGVGGGFLKFFEVRVELGRGVVVVWGVLFGRVLLVYLF